MPFRAMYVGWQPESKMAKICPIKNHRVLNFRRGIYLIRFAFESRVYSVIHATSCHMPSAHTSPKFERAAPRLRLG